MSASKIAFNPITHSMLVRLPTMIKDLAAKGAQDPTFATELDRVAGQLSLMLSDLSRQMTEDKKGINKDSPNLHHLAMGVNLPAGTPGNLPNVLYKLNESFKNALNDKGSRAIITKLVRTKDFVDSVVDMVGLVANTQKASMDAKFGVTFMGVANKLLEEILHATANPTDTSRHMLASDGDTMDDSALDLGPETSIPAEEPQDKPAPHEPPAGGAEGMMGSIDSLVQSIDSFLVNLPVTAFHDRDAEKAARARAKATELRDDVLIIRKQVSDTRAAINGDPGHTERFASLARSVALKFARNTGK